MASKLSAEELKEKIFQAKEDRKAVKEEFKQFCKDKKLSTEEEPTEEKEKYLPKWKKLKDAIEKRNKAVEDLEAKKGEIKKEKKERTYKYDYPDTVKTSDDRKKYRAEQRAAFRKAEKASNKGKKTVKKVEEKKAPIKSKPKKTVEKKSRPIKREAPEPETVEAGID